MAQKRLNATRIKIGLCSASVLLILAFYVAALGQRSTPQRGFQPSGSYALSDIETINIS
jgi:hypothetical protein